ncbi:MAG TPA: LamG domain-containing protein [Polyangia bacterium]|nr:LamG domain-containing protein [Polyangia bacterium]
MARRPRFLAPALAGAGLLAGLGCSPGPIDVATLPSGGLLNGLVAYWPLDEGSGTLADDASGNERNGFVAGPSWIPGQFGSALHFSGANYMSAGSFPPATPSYSVSAWVLIQPYEVGAPIANLVSTETPGGGWALYAMLGQGNESYVFQFLTPGAPQGYTVSCACVVPGSWVHLVAVVDGDAATLTLYVNGVPTTVATTSALFPGSSVLYLARSAALSPTFPLTGALDDVAIYSRALVPQEVAALGQGPVLPAAPP